MQFISYSIVNYPIHQLFHCYKSVIYIVCLAYADVQCDVRMYLMHSVNVALNHFSAITAQKTSFPLRVSSVNVNKSAVSCGFGHI